VSRRHRKDFEIAAFLWFWSVRILHMDLPVTGCFKATDALKEIPGPQVLPCEDT
jgi:hypothetical protein